MRHWRSITLVLDVFRTAGGLQAASSTGWAGLDAQCSHGCRPGGFGRDRMMARQPVRWLAFLTHFALYQPVNEYDWRMGPPDAVVTIIEYSDFQCPYCVKLEQNLQELLEAYPDDVQLVFRHYPAPIS